MKMVVALVVLGAYLQAGWLGVAAALAGFALPYLFILFYALRHGDAHIEIER